MQVSVWMKRVLCVAIVGTAIAMAGCDKKPDAKQPEPSKPQAQKPATGPLVPVVKAADWCKEHVVPESICTRCNKELIAEFKKKGDWCKEHDVPESQCIKCHPELKAKFEAMAPKG